MTKAQSVDQTPRRDMVMRELGRQMRLVSEEAAYSMWAWRIEDELPAVVHEAAASGKPGDYQGVEISPVYAAWLTALAAELSHWVMPGPGLDYVPYVPRALPGAGGSDPGHVSPPAKGPAT
ncbi:MAG TPA: hypothetical protein VMS17_27460 [Gemmataceae bacterium]|nr:hypothetical protein [Gemmataceae bacterium]